MVPTSTNSDILNPLNGIRIIHPSEQDTVQDVTEKYSLTQKAIEFKNVKRGLELFPIGYKD